MARLQRLAIASTQRQQQQIYLTPSQHHYLIQVLRLTVGDRFLAILEPGERWLAELSSSQVALLLEEVEGETELAVPVTLLAALPKGQGFDQVVYQATELGVSRIIPLISDRTLLQPSEQKLERWRRIVREATEQSGRLVVPRIDPPLPLSLAISAFNPTDQQLYFCTPNPTAPHLADRLADAPLSPITIALGPEGGWTETEMTQAQAAGFQSVGLGQRVLRAVTAPIVALSLVAAHLERGNLTGC